MTSFSLVGQAGRYKIWFESLVVLDHDPYPVNPDPIPLRRLAIRIMVQEINAYQFLHKNKISFKFLGINFDIITVAKANILEAGEVSF